VPFESAEAAQARRLRQVRAAYKSPRRKAVLAAAVENLATIEAGKGNARLAVHFAIKEYNAVRRAGSQRGKGGGAELRRLAEVGHKEMWAVADAFWKAQTDTGRQPTKDQVIDELRDKCSKPLSRERIGALISIRELKRRASA
jgi:hypothetical protein